MNNKVHYTIVTIMWIAVAAAVWFMLVPAAKFTFAAAKEACEKSVTEKPVTTPTPAEEVIWKSGTPVPPPPETEIKASVIPEEWKDDSPVELPETLILDSEGTDMTAVDKFPGTLVFDGVPDITECYDVTIGSIVFKVNGGIEWDKDRPLTDQAKELLDVLSSVSYEWRKRNALNYIQEQLESKR